MKDNFNNEDRSGGWVRDPFLRNRNMAEHNVILECLVGSFAYGTNIPGSDKDYRGIFVPDKEYVLGLKNYDQFEQKSPDRVIFTIRKFFKLALAFNPNIVELLWSSEDCIKTCTPLGKKILDNRNIFVSKLAHKTYGGYAMSQLKRLKNKAGRCGNRSDIVEKYGYDTKHGMHLIRLLETGTEFLLSGEVLVKRPNADFLQQIRYGRVRLEKLTRYSEELMKNLDIAERKSKLPEKPDYVAANKLLIEIIEEFWDAV